MDAQTITAQLAKDCEGHIQYARTELQAIRTGKASPSLVENIMVDAYAGQSRLKLQELSTISAQDPTTLIVTPFDPSTVGEIEKAILSSPLNLSPRVEGKMLRIMIPPLSEEQRINFVRLANQKAEEAKNHSRSSRDDARKRVKAAFEEKSLTEDEKFRLEKEIDEMTKKYVDEIEELKKRKQEEIMSL